MNVLSLKCLIVIVFSMAQASFGSRQEKREPICSRYHYEEMLLEKMIRLEHGTNLMMEEFREIKTKVDNTLSTVQHVTADMKSTSEEMQGNVKQATQEMKAKVQEVIQTNTDVMAKITAALQKSSYAFSVYDLSDTSLSEGENVIFKKKLLDEGGLYDTSSGKYNIPVSGFYYFTASVCCNSNDYGAVNFEADGDRLGTFDFGDRSYKTCSTGSAIAKLQKNTKVGLKTVNSFTANTEESSGRFNYFSGYLINKQD